MAAKGQEASCSPPGPPVLLLLGRVVQSRALSLFYRSALEPSNHKPKLEQARGRGRGWGHQGGRFLYQDDEGGGT